MDEHALDFLSSSKGRCLIAGLALILSFFIQGQRGLWQPDEGRYAEAAREMLESHNYLVPSLDGHAHLSKPPVTYWAIALGIKVLGENGWGVRLYLSLASFLSILLIGWIAARLGGDRKLAPLAALIYSTMLLPHVAAHVVTCDTLLTFFSTAGLAAFVLEKTSEPGLRRDFARLGVSLAFGLAFLTKGLPALLLAAVPVIHGRLAPADWGLRISGAPGGEGGEGTSSKRCSSGISLPAHIASALIFLLLALGWYAIQVKRDSSLLRYFLSDEVMGRIFTGRHHRNPHWYGIFTIYAPTLILGTLPWTGACRHLHGVLKAAHPRQEPVLFLLFLWICVPILVFALASSKLWLYPLPVFPALAIAFSMNVLKALRSGKSLRFVPSPLAISGWALMLLLLRATLWLPSWPRDSHALWRSLPSPGSARLVQMGGESVWNWGLDFYASGRVEHHPWTTVSAGGQSSSPFDIVAREALENHDRTVILLRRKDRERAQSRLNLLGIEGDFLTVHGGHLALVIPAERCVAQEGWEKK